MRAGGTKRGWLLRRFFVYLTTGLTTFAAPIGVAAAQPNVVKDVRVAVRPLPSGPTVSEISIKTGAAPLYTARVTGGGRRLLIDIADAELAQAIAPTSEAVGLVAGLLTQTFRSASGTTVRVAISLAQRVTYRIRPEPNGLVVSLMAEEPSPHRASADEGRPRGRDGSDADQLPSHDRSDADRQGRSDGTRAIEEAQPRGRSDTEPNATVRVRDVRFERGSSGDSVVVTLSRMAAYSASQPTQTKSKLELAGVELPKELDRILDVARMSTRVRAITTHQSGSKVVLEAERLPDVTGQVTTEGATLIWTFRRATDVPSVETGLAPDGGPARRSRTLARERVGGEIPRIETSFNGSDEPIETRAEPAHAAAFLPAMAAQHEGQTRYTGRRIDLDLKDADVHNVLRLLADVGRINVVTADTVSGNITIRMRNVPWDQALDVVLQAKGLGMVRQGNLVRVAPLAELEKERELMIARRKQELELAPVETRLVPVSYAHAAEIQPRAHDMLSARGSIAVDERTNVLIVRDVAPNLNQVEELVRSLDTQTPQVLVEARIVEATSRYSRDIGIQWGGDASFSPATGNPTGLAFPSSVGIVGGASDGQTPRAGLSPFDRTVANPNFAVNLPAAVGTGSGGALGLALGSINNSINIGVRLSALEASGMVRIVSSPRILTMDNRDAWIAQGTLIPFAQVSAQGVQTTFQEAKLQLLVRPHVTAEGSVAMHVKVNRDEPDFTQTSPRGDPTILKREAETDLLVMDGHTAVIGGIYTRNTGRNLDQVPFFGDIPILGVLFQRRRASDTRGELVIFLTPRIVNRAEALGR